MSTQEGLDHLRKHEEAGHKVPQKAFDNVASDKKYIDQFITDARGY
jgi:hypothetical protein